MTARAPAVPAQASSWPVKFRRAQDHLTSIASQIEWWRAGRSFDISTEFDAETKQNIAYVDRFDALPLRWSAIIGDCVQNLRSTLDHLVNELALDHSGRANETTEFPIFLDAAKFALARGRKIGLVSEQAQQVIEELQPFQRGASKTADPVWLLHELSRVDKHRSVHLVAVTLAPYLLVRGERLEMEIATPLERGSVIGRFGDADLQRFAGLNPETEMEFHLNANIAFGDGPARDRLVIDVLQEITRAVGDASARLAGLLTKAPPADWRR